MILLNSDTRPGSTQDIHDLETNVSGTLTETAVGRALILGLGNILLRDDGIGIHVVQALQARQLDPHVTVRDGGTIGLALLSDIESSASLIAVDAMELDEKPGTIRTYVGPAMDRHLGGKKRTAHEVALADLIAAARLTGVAPERRALVAIQPESIEWGLDPTEAVRAAIPSACEAVCSLVEGWNRG